MAEHVNLLRRISPWICMFIALGLWVVLVRLEKLNAWLALGLLAYLLSQEFLLYQASMARSELYALAYWVAAVVALSAWVQAGVQRFRWQGGSPRGSSSGCAS